MTQPPPVVFQIGFNRCGTKFISDLFSRNGYEARHWGMGFIAEDIFYSKATGQTPLQPWPTANLFSDMECTHRYDKPFLEGYKEFRFLHEQYPDALFILNERDPEAWLASRNSHHDGQYIRFHAHHLNLPQSEVPAFWLRDWHHHIEDVLGYFGQSPQLIRYNLDTNTPEDLAEALSPWYQITKLPPKIGKHVKKRRSHQLDGLREITRGADTSQARGLVSPEDSFVDSVSAHCIGERDADASPLGRRSEIYAHWDGAQSVLDRRGEPWPLIRSRMGDQEVFLAKARVSKLERIQGVLNDMLRLGSARDVEIDMQDARGFGADGMGVPESPLITYNRRPEARNMPLWPVAPYHTIGERHFALPEPLDKIPFEDKQDKVGWRGNLCGLARRERFPDADRLRPSHQILNEMKVVSRNSAEEAALEDELMRLTRYSFVKRHFDQRDFDLGFTIGPQFNGLKKKSPFSKFCVELQPLTWHYGYRYIVSLSGFDTGSNFIVAANSNSVVLKEEDGWEVFYSGAFKPWEHYVPLAAGAEDVQEKLEWARSHRTECREIVAASQAVCAKFASRVLRDQILRNILDSL